jgi:hypothetical protein
LKLGRLRFGESHCGARSARWAISVALSWWLIYDESRRLGGDTTKEVPAN